MWQLPVPVSITGTVAFSTTLLMSPAPPRGMSTSRYWFIFIIFVALSRLVSSQSITASGEISVSERAFFITSTRHLLEFIASLPPRRSTLLPLLRHKTAASTVTLGRASYMMPITPIGTLTFLILSPLGLFHSSTTSPTGSGRRVISSTEAAKASTLLPSSMSLSTKDSFMPFSRATAISFLFSSIIMSACSLNAFAMSKSALFFSSFVLSIMLFEAFFALSPASYTVIILSHSSGKNCSYFLFFENAVNILGLIGRANHGFNAAF